MSGLIFYFVVAAGMGCLAPISLRSGMSIVGLRLAFGYAAMVIFAYVAHILFGISLGTTVTILLILSLTGFAVLLRQENSLSQWAKLLIHPAIILIVAGAVAIALNGGINYLPYSNDEFSHWSYC